MNFWLAWRYNRRNMGYVLPTVGILAITVFAAVVITAALNSLAYTALSNYGHLQRFSEVEPVQNIANPTELVRQIQAHPSVAETHPYQRMSTSLRLLVATTSFDILAVDADTMNMLLGLYGISVKEGRLPTPGTNELVLSEPVAKAKGISVGDKVGEAVDDEEWLPGEFELVGILEGETRLGLVSLEYLSDNELYARYSEGLLVIPADQQMDELNAFLEKIADESGQVKIISYQSIVKRTQQEMLRLYTLLAFVNLLAVAVISLAMGVLNYVYFLHRIPEFAILQALGFNRRFLLGRCLEEIGSLLGLAWLVGVFLALGVLVWIEQAVYSPRGLVMNVTDLKPILLSLPIPIIVSLCGVLAILRPLWQLDPVTVIDRRL